MYDPFKRSRAKAHRKLRRASVAAITDMWGALLTPAKPARKPAKANKPATTRRGSAKTAPPRTGADRVPATLRSRPTGARGATFRNGTHDSAFGRRAYKLYVPKLVKTADAPLPLVVMLHGCGQSPQDFARGTGMNALAEEYGFLVLYPAQSRQAQFNRCWNWFKREDQARGAGEPALIAGLTREIVGAHRVDPARVYVAGLSAGGSAAMIVATAYPDIFAAVGVHSGLPVGAAQDAASATHAMQGGAPGRRHAVRMPTIVFHGDADKVVNPRNGRFVALRAVAPYARLDRSEVTGRVSGGHAYTRTRHRIGRGRPYSEHWVVHGSGHGWSGGHAGASYTDPAGPDASREMIRFFLRHRTTKKRRSAPAP
ncbi:extracellular catalytic domain type 1 short-chain-length polyhydroxyalkanoate depolymerase [Roseivivax sp. CAU 1753]